LELAALKMGCILVACYLPLFFQIHHKNSSVRIKMRFRRINGKEISKNFWEVDVNGVEEFNEIGKRRQN
jgi:hypothetical protein